MRVQSCLSGFSNQDQPLSDPLPVAELEMLVSDRYGNAIDRRRIPDSGLSVSDLTDWDYRHDERENSADTKQFERIMQHHYDTDDNAENSEESTTVEAIIEKENAHPDIEHRNDGKPIAGEEWIGEFIYTSWGYGQTNVNMGIIVDVSNSGRTVIAQMVGMNRVDGYKSSDSMAPTEIAYGDKFRLRVQEDGNSPWFRGSYPYIDGDMDKGKRLDSFMPWGDRKSVHQTATGYGH